MRAVFLTLPLATLSACALLSGLSDVRVCDGGCDQDATTTADVITQDSPACTTSCANVPAGWRLLGMGTATCPSGTSKMTLVTQPMAPSTGVCPCTCGSAPATMPSCGNGTVGGAQGGNGCTTALQLKTTGCFATTFQLLPATIRVEGTSPEGGACGAPDSTPINNLIMRTNVDACVPSSGCGESLCGATGIRLCIATPGVAQCPSAFPTMQTWGTDVSATCSCAACNLTRSCTKQTVSFYADANCTSLVTSVTANNVCLGQQGVGAPVSAYKYDQTLTASCSGTQGTPAVDLVNKQTVCCKN